MRIRSLFFLPLVLLILTINAEAKIPFKTREFNLINKNIDISDPQFVIKKMKVTEISEAEIEPSLDDYEVKVPMAVRANRFEVNNVIAVIDKIIAIGEKLIPLIEKGRAVVRNNNMDAISVIPNLENNRSSLSELTNWSLPVTKHFKVVFENTYGIDVVSFMYSVSFQYGGSYAGKGKYLTGVRVASRNIEVMWGFDLDAHSKLIQISNLGTTTNVVAGATIEINYTVGNFLNVISTSESFHVTGDGRIYKLD